jgi:hypothetical protein
MMPRKMQLEQACCPWPVRANERRGLTALALASNERFDRSETAGSTNAAYLMSWLCGQRGQDEWVLRMGMG